MLQLIQDRFNAVLATASINNAIDYYNLFKKMQEHKLLIDNSFIKLNVACVFSPPAEGNKDIQQIQEDLEQEKKIISKIQTKRKQH